MTPRKINGMGWIPQFPDHRDRRLPKLTGVVLPSSVDLRGLMPAVYDQKELGSCTSNAIAAALQLDALKDAMSDQAVPSRLWIYYQERVIEHTVGQDSGAMLRDGAKAVSTVGCVDESAWPYDISTFMTPPLGLVPFYKALEYLAVDQDESSVKGCLAEGYPMVFGFTVYDSFESSQVARTGIVPMPGQGEDVLGGHAVLAVGYDDATRRFMVRNSWGDAWGQAGYFEMPYDYLLNGDLATDFWTYRRIG
jgi:C1A family cysteine protease